MKGRFCRNVWVQTTTDRPLELKLRPREELVIVRIRTSVEGLKLRTDPFLLDLVHWLKTSIRPGQVIGIEMPKKYPEHQAAINGIRSAMIMGNLISRRSLKIQRLGESKFALVITLITELPLIKKRTRSR